MISVRELSFSYGSRRVLNGISLEAKPGELVCVLGRNGAGKTTLFKCILGLLNGYTGEVLIDGENIMEMDAGQRARSVAYIYTTLEEFRALNVPFFLVSRAMVSVMADIEGVDIWANFTESEEGVVAELRSTRVDVSPVAFRYGGGGHPKACGATVRSREEAMKMLEDLDLLAAEK